MLTRLHAALALAGALVALCPQIAAADDRSRSAADRHLRAGLAAYQEARYDRAIRAFLAGYAVEPRREFLFALAQAERLSGDCASAVVYYRRFLSRNPPDRQARAATEQLEKCRRALSSGPAASRGDQEKREVRPVPSTARSRSRRPAAPDRGKRWYRDAIGNTLLGAGAGLWVAAGAFYLSADAASSAARGAGSYPEFDRQADRAASRQRMAIGLTIAGAALVGGAVYRYLGVTRETEAAPAVGLSVAPGGVVGLALGGRF
jgi:hypothetical protein